MKHARIFDATNPQHRSDLYVDLLLRPRTQTEQPKEQKHVVDRR